MLTNRPLFRRLVGNSLWQIGDKAFRTAGGVLIGIYIARYLGPADFGLLSFATAIAALFGAVAALGLPSIVVRDLVSRPQDRAAVLASALLLRLAGGAIATVLAYCAAVLLREGDARTWAIVAIVAISNLPQAWDIVDYDYQARMHAKPIALSRDIGFLATSLLRIGLVFSRAPLVWFAWAITIESTLSALLMAMLWRVDNLSVPLSRVTRREIKKLFLASWPLLIAGLSVSIYMRLDQIMIGRMLGNAAVGMFSAAVRISEALYFIPIAVTASLAPALTAMHQKSAPVYAAQTARFTRFLVYMALAIAVVFSAFSTRLVAALYGLPYAGAAPVLAIHTWAGVFVSLGVSGSLWLTNAGYLKYAMYQTLAGAAVNAGLNILLIPKFGIIGAAFATCIGQFVSVVAMIAAWRKTRPLFWLQLSSLWPRVSAIRD